ncbi:MAG: hypothetical protein V4773_09970 [Verrucomicrobiota bacterium]
MSRSESAGAGALSSGVNDAIMSSFLFSARARRRIWSMALFRAVVINQATGLGGGPRSGHCWSAMAKASCTQSSASVISRTVRISVARMRP